MFWSFVRLIRDAVGVVTKGLLRHFGKRVAKQVQTFPRSGAQKNAPDLITVTSLDRRGGQGEVDLVPHQDLRHVGRADLGKNLVHRSDLGVAVLAGRIHHMKQQVGLRGFLECRLEAATSACGRSRMKPTVSESTTFAPPT